MSLHQMLPTSIFPSSLFLRSLSSSSFSFCSCFSFSCPTTSQNQYLFLLARQQCVMYTYFVLQGKSSTGELVQLLVVLYLPEMPFLPSSTFLLYALLLLLLLPVHIIKQCVVYCRGRAAQECTRAWRGWGPCATSTAPCCWWTRCAAWEGCPSSPTTGGWTACTPAPRSASAHRQVTDTTEGLPCEKSLFVNALTAHKRLSSNRA